MPGNRDIFGVENDGLIWATGLSLSGFPVAYFGYMYLRFIRSIKG
jgi:hypothetical protein